VTRVTLYGKPGCHLCESAYQVVLAVGERREFELEEVDITLDAGLHREYAERIPVVAVDGEELFEYHVDPGELEERLDKVTP
jgi:glutaredoxin